MIRHGSLMAIFGAALALLLVPFGAAEARGGTRAMVTTSWVEEWDPAAQRWVRVADSPAAVLAEAGSVVSRSTARASAAAGVVVTETILVPDDGFAIPRPHPQRPGAGAPLAQYGPFRVLDERRAALVAATDIASPRHFDAMLHDFPGLAVLEMRDAPGTSHDLANLALGRKIRAAGLETHVPPGGSVRSGAVELFLAGTRYSIAPEATFAVHSWLDTRGMEPRHFAPDAPENRLYLDYYQEMGMPPEHARAFYAMTNSVPHSGALWLDAAAMERWIAPLAAQPAPAPAPAPAPVPALAATGAADGLADGVAGEALPVVAVEMQPAPKLSPVLVWFEPPVLTLASLAITLDARLDARLDSGALFL